ncbi:coiled-coil domain-containing protein [Bacillus mycoides]|uniref:coiled-coil domain-containing protein n=1 Tax=Bacillus mycoides TaxID=1405 RepID=UPI00366B372C
MLDIDWIMSLTSDEYLKKIAKEKNFSFRGFIEGWTAPPTHLRNQLKAAFKGKQVKSTKPVMHIKMLLNTILKSTVEEFKITIDDTPTLEEFYINVEMNPNMKEIQVIAYYSLLFEKEFEENMDKVRQNIEQDKPVLSGISTVAGIDPLEKINAFIHNSLTAREVTSMLNTLEKTIQKNTRKKNYEKLQEELAQLDENEQSDENDIPLNFLLDKLSTTEKVDRPVVILAFLKYKDNYSKAKYHFLTQYLYTYTVKLKEKNAKTLKTKAENQLNELQVQHEEALEKIEELLAINEQKEEQIKKVHQEQDTLQKKMEEKLQEQSLQESILEEEKDENNKQLYNLQNYQEAINPLLSVFTRILEENPLLLITEDTKQLAHTPFQDNCICIEELHTDLRNSDATAYEDYKLFIERAYFTNSIDWLNFKSLLEKHSLNYTELSGYDLSDWLLQLIVAINKEEINHGHYTYN